MTLKGTKTGEENKMQNNIHFNNEIIFLENMVTERRRFDHNKTSNTGTCFEILDSCKSNVIFKF